MKTNQLEVDDLVTDITTHVMQQLATKLADVKTCHLRRAILHKELRHRIATSMDLILQPE